ncbi:hypothetical protein HispidOSU_012010 [Sigmodon hispidus]
MMKTVHTHAALRDDEFSCHAPAPASHAVCSCSPQNDIIQKIQAEELQGPHGTPLQHPPVPTAPRTPHGSPAPPRVGTVAPRSPWQVPSSSRSPQCSTGNHRDSLRPEAGRALSMAGRKCPPHSDWQSNWMP